MPTKKTGPDSGSEESPETHLCPKGSMAVAQEDQERVRSIERWIPWVGAALGAAMALLLLFFL